MPRFRRLTESQWRDKNNFFRDIYNPCEICPRRCGARRLEGESGVCGVGNTVRVASYNLHFGEEPPITGSRGSGTVFFSGCPLKCVFCQNYPISHLGNGQEYSIEELAGLFLNLQTRGAHNINFVSPTPYLHHIVQALEIAAGKGLRLPIVDNTSGYELLGVVKMLEGIVDVWLPDFKYHDPQLARLVSGAPGYREIAYDAIGEMFKQVGELRVDDEGIAVSGTIIRHLVLPGQVENSKRVLDIIAGSRFKSACLSLMSQFFPAYEAPKSQLSRRITADEYWEVRGYAEQLGFEDGWFQDI